KDRSADYNDSDPEISSSSDEINSNNDADNSICDNLVTISWRQLAFTKFSLMTNLATLIYLTYAYAVMPNKLRSDTISILMITWICMAWFNPLIQIVNTSCIYHYWGVTMNKKRWMALLPENQRPWNYG